MVNYYEFKHARVALLTHGPCFHMTMTINQVSLFLYLFILLSVFLFNVFYRGTEVLYMKVQK